MQSSTPNYRSNSVWPSSISLAATLEIEFSFSSCRYLDVSVHDVPSITLWIHAIVTELFSAGFPHSDICGSLDICSLPQLFAAYHVLHRLLVPRHPPYALLRLIISSFELLTSWSDPLSLAEDSCCLTCCLLLLLKLIRVRISSLIFLSFQISFCLLITFVILFEFLGSPLLRSLLITLFRLICNFQGPITSTFVEVLKFFASLWTSGFCFENPTV